MQQAGTSRAMTIYKHEHVGSPQSLLSDIIPSQMYTLTNIINKIKRHDGNIFFIVVETLISTSPLTLLNITNHSRGDIWCAPWKLATATQPHFLRNVANFKQATGFQIFRRTLRKLMFD
jgi:hypothetical protein